MLPPAMVKIALIGAGSVVFCKNLTGDLLSFPEFADATLAYMDIDRDRLEVAAGLCRKVARTLGAAVERALESDGNPFEILQTVAACRGALNSLMVEIIEGHVRLHLLDPAQPPSAEQTEAAEELIDIVRAFLR